MYLRYGHWSFVEDYGVHLGTDRGQSGDSDAESYSSAALQRLTLPSNLWSLEEWPIRRGAASELLQALLVPQVLEPGVVVGRRSEEGSC